MPRRQDNHATLQAQLRHEADHLMSNGWATLTKSQYEKAAVYFIRWIIFMQAGHLLLDYSEMQNNILPLYIAFLARSVGSGTVRSYLHGVRTFYIMRGLPNPLSDHFGLGHIQRGLKRLKPGGSKQKLPITIHILYAIILACNATGTAADAAIASAATIAFFAFLRKSNVTVGRKSTDSQQEFTHAATAGNIWIDEATETLWIRLVCTKTIQFGERELFIPLQAIPNSIICPLTCWRRHLSMSNLPRDPYSHAFAFQYPRGQSWHNLTHAAFVAATKAGARALGLDPAKYASHSYSTAAAAPPSPPPAESAPT